MPILVILFLTAACMPAPWPNPFGLSLRQSAFATAVAISVPIGCAIAVRRWVLRTLKRDPDRRAEVGDRYDRIRRGLFFMNVGAVILAVLGSGWGASVWNALTISWHGHQELLPFAELAVPLPYFLIVFASWLIHYDAERRLHRSANSDRPFWSRTGYFFHNFRQMALFVMLPVGLLVIHQSLSRFMPGIVQSNWYRILSLSAVPVMILFAPLLIKPLFGLKSMPAGLRRERIEKLARRLHFRYTDLLVWPTHGSVLNAMIIGLIPRVRYVIFTDAILDEMPPEELDAVFGHEVGHARHGHIWYYAFFLILSMAVVTAAFVRSEIKPESLVAVAAAAYIFIVFGFLSRRCERQADIFGCRAVSCSEPHCEKHTEETIYPERGLGLCATGIKTCARALDHVHAIHAHSGYDEGRSGLSALLRGVFGWLRAWQHSPMPHRIRYLHSLLDDRQKEARFQRRATWLRWLLAIGLIAALLFLGQSLGWRKLFEML